MSDIKITSGNMLTGLGLSDTKADIDKISSFFSDQTKPEKKTQKKASSERKPVKNITKDNLRHLESKDIKADWEKVTPPKRTNEAGAFDSKAISASRSQAQNDYGGRSTVSSGLNSIFDPNRQKKVAREGGKMGEQIKSDAQKKRDAIAAQHAKTNDWEKIEAAKNSKNLRPAQMGFTPNRSEIKEYETPKVDIPGIKKIKDSNQKSSEAGKEAAKIKEKVDNVFRVRYEKEANDKRGWEEIQSDKIARTQTRKMDVKQESVKISRDDIKMSIKEKVEEKQASNQDAFKGMFSVPHFEEKNIKRKSDDIKSDRKRREDDRSWERISTPKKTW